MYTSILASAVLLVSTAIADNGYGSGGSGGYGGGSYGSGGSSYSSSAGWESWPSSSDVAPAGTVAPAVAAPSMPPAAPPAGELIVQVVSVADANGSLKYFPNSVQAPVGSIVQFQFHPKNHTVTESTFAQPCMPLAVSNASAITPTRPGLKSGFVPVTGMESETPVYNVLINDTKPIWIYCGQTNHCQKGMAMVINQNLTSTDKTIENYIAAAMALPLIATNATSTTSTTSTIVVAPPAPPATSTSVVIAPPPPPPPPSTETTSAGLPAPTPPAAITTTAAVAPATFTGAASRQEGQGILAGIAVIGLAALL